MNNAIERLYTEPQVLMVGYGNADTPSSYTHRIKKIAHTLSDARLLSVFLWFSPFYRMRKSSQFDDLREKTTVIVRPSLPLVAVQGVSPIGRQLCSVIVRRVATAYSVDTIHAETPLCASLARYALPGRRLVVDLHGDVTAELRMNGAGNWKRAISERDFEATLQDADTIIAASQALRDMCATRLCRKDMPIFVVPCSTSIGQFALRNDERLNVRKKLGISDRHVLCYCGGTDVWQCIPETLRIVASIRRLDPRVFFLFMTSGNVKPFQNNLEAVGKENEDYLVLSLRPEEVPHYLPAADVGFLIRANNPVNAVSSPTKLAEYLAAGVPVITTCFAGDAASIIRDTGCGFVLDSIEPSPDEISWLRQYIANIVAKRDFLFDMCREKVNAYHNWEQAAQILLGAY